MSAAIGTSQGSAAGRRSRVGPRQLVVGRLRMAATTPTECSRPTDAWAGSSRTPADGERVQPSADHLTDCGDYGRGSLVRPSFRPASAPPQRGRTSLRRSSCGPARPHGIDVLPEHGEPSAWRPDPSHGATSVSHSVVASPSRKARVSTTSSGDRTPTGCVDAKYPAAGHDRRLPGLGNLCRSTGRDCARSSRADGT